MPHPPFTRNYMFFRKGTYSGSFSGATLDAAVAAGMIHEDEAFQIMMDYLSDPKAPVLTPTPITTPEP